MKTVRAGVAGAIVLLGGATAQAEEPTTETRAALATQRARQTYREGVDAFNRKDFEAARIAFLQTLALKPDVPEVRRNLGLAEIYSGHYLEGARRVARVLHSNNAGSAQDRTRMLESLKMAEAHLERLTIEVDVDDALVEVDGVELGKSPLPFVWYVSPGDFSIRVSRAGYLSHAENRSSKAGVATHLRVHLPVKRVVRVPLPVVRAQLAPPPYVSRESRAQTAGWVVGGVATAAGLIAGGLLARLALDVGSEWKEWANRNESGDPDICLQDNPMYADYCEEASRLRAEYNVDRNLSMTALGFAGVAAVSTLVYVYWPRGKSDKSGSDTAGTQDLRITDVGLAWGNRSVGLQVSASF